MKTLQKIGLLLFLSLLISCESNEDDLGGSGGDDFFTAKIDGETFTAFTGPPDTVAWNSAHTGLRTIQGSTSDGLAITMNITNYNGVGIYDFSKTGFIQFVSGVTTGNFGAWTCNATSSTTGSVEITADDGTVIEGTLSFTGLNTDDKSTKVITEGKFRATKDK